MVFEALSHVLGEGGRVLASRARQVDDHVGHSVQYSMWETHLVWREHDLEVDPVHVREGAEQRSAGAFGVGRRDLKDPVEDLDRPFRPGEEQHVSWVAEYAGTLGSDSVPEEGPLLCGAQTAVQARQFVGESCRNVGSIDGGA